jgi:dTDP-4-amino-4,6-dideoxygalactose transaminase
MQFRIPHSKPFIGREEIDAVARVLRSGQLSQGRQVQQFELECAQLLRRRHAVAVSSGTAALHLALGALGVPEEEAVAVPSYSCAALVTAVRLQQAKPVLCDIGDDYNLDPSVVPDYCNFAIVPHLFGAVAQLPSGIAVVEDIAQAMGGVCGRATPVAVTSFYATKLMTTGEGGMLLTDDEGIADYARDRRGYDNRDDFKVRYPYKMTEFQAVIGRVQLRRLMKFLERRREIADRYHEAFDFLPLRLPNPERHVFFRYVVGTGRRGGLEVHLRKHGIEAKRPVHCPMHHLLGGAFPKSQQAHEECLSLPIYPAMIEGEVAHVIESVQRFFT